MKKPILLAVYTILFLCMSSCIKDEPLFREADIDAFNLPDDIMINSVITESDTTILVMVSDTVGIQERNFAPKILISPNATIEPAVGDSIKFQNYEAVYKVTSEDGTISKTYNVKIVPFVKLKFDFEDWTTGFYGGTKEYPLLNDKFWDNANYGVAMVKSYGLEDYPTRWTTDSYKGKYAALLETQKGVKILFIKIPIFAGSMFRGSFKLDIGSPAKSAHFGQIHPEYAGKPVLFKGYYKYKPGDVFTDKDEKVVEGRVDECSIYAVMYKVTKGAAGREEYLDGSNINTSDKVVARADLTDTSAKGEYTAFSIPFVYSEELNYNQYDYKLAIVFSSSKNGDSYEGAVGSTLIVDEVEVVCDKIKK